VDDSVSPCRVDLPRDLLFLTDTLFRKVYQEIDRKLRHRGSPGSVGQIDSRRDADGICGAVEDHTQC
jgi:hypothetical protein